jgi:hypothetical protein
MSAHFHPSERAIARWLRQEIRKVGLFFPFISTTGGCGSKEFAVALAIPSDETDAELMAGVDAETPAAAHAAGFEMPAFVKAAAIFCCWLMSHALVGPRSGESWITWVAGFNGG